MAFNPMKIKEEAALECQACGVHVTNIETSSEQIKVFKELTGIEPICANSDIAFCKNCQSTLEAFQMFKNLCFQTQEMFAIRQVCDEQEIKEEFTVEIYVDECNVLNQEEDKYYICDVCQKTFKTKSGIKNHFRRMHSKMIPTLDSYECEECNAKFASLRNLKRHQKTHNPEKSFKCSFCDSKFHTQQNQYYHEKYVHKTGRKYICSDCGYICYNPTSMNQHFLRHHSTSKFQCNQCPKACKTPRDLKEHQRVHENLLKTVPCPECGAMFKHPKAMRSHLRTVHTAERKYMCETCSKGFISKQRLNRHLVTHTGERQFPCNHCTQAFTQQQALKRHLTTHTGVRPFSCPHCNHTFAEKFYMKKHASNCAKKAKEAPLTPM